MTCHDESNGSGGLALGAPLIALAGNPNTGKSTLFNGITGARRAVGNYPGTTVEIGRGECRLGEAAIAAEVLDLPGAYSLDGFSPDEELTRSLLRERRPDVLVVVIDASCVERCLYLVAQARELPLRVVLVVTMADVAARRGIAVDPGRLSACTGAPVVVLDPRRTGAADAVRAAITTALRQPVPDPLTFTSRDEVIDLGGHGDAGAVDALDTDLATEDSRLAWIETAVIAGVTTSTTPRRTWSDRIDRIVTAPVAGILIFLAIMWIVFQITTTVAAPLMEALSVFLTGPVSDGARSLFGLGGWESSPVAGFVIDGIIAGVGTVLAFVPLMALMFGLLALLEDSGYMARAAVVTDRLMRRIGLPGRAFLPLVVGFGCNVPAVASVRVLSDSRHRLLTALLVPLTSCTARLTVYVLVATTFFGSSAGTVVFAMYVLSVLLVVGVGFLLRSTLLRDMGSEALIIDLPPYHRPAVRLVSAVTWVRLRGFLATASGIIVATVTGVWILSNVPATPGYAIGDVPVEDSVYAAAAKTVAPVFEPAGFGDWRATSSLMTGFIAKEAVISSWAQSYSLGEPEDPSTPGSLGDRVQADFAVSSGGHGQAAALAFLVFLLAYTPCMATLAAQRRQIGNRWTATGVALQLAVAYVLAVVVFQALSRLPVSGWWSG